jgi:hypothetical protein
MSVALHIGSAILAVATEYDQEIYQLLLQAALNNAAPVRGSIAKAQLPVDEADAVVKLLFNHCGKVDRKEVDYLLAHVAKLANIDQNRSCPRTQ